MGVERVSEYAYQDNLLGAVLIDATAQTLLADVESAVFEGEERQAVAAYVARHAGTIVATTPKDLQKYDTYVKILLLKADARYATWNDYDRFQETARLLRQVITEHKKKEKEVLQQKLRDAETSHDDELSTELLHQITVLNKEINRG
jgi:hypothetical protein